MPRYSRPEYFDVVNIDWYEVLIGTPFMHQHKVVLDFNRKCMRVNGHDIPAIIVMGEGLEKDANQYRLRQPALVKDEE